MSILIRNGIVVTMDENRRIIKDGAIFIDDSKIVAVGKTEDIEREYKADITIDAKGYVVLPGFVNTHDHLFQMLFKSLGDDKALFEWWSGVVAPLSCYLDEDACYYAALAGCIELIKSGVTCTVDNHYVFTKPDLAAETLKAFDEIGIRGIQGRGLIDVDYFNLAPPGFPIERTDQAIKNTVDLVKRFHGKSNGRLMVWFGPAAPFMCSDELLNEIRDKAEELNTRITMHFHETLDEVRGWKEMKGTTPIKYFYEKGVRIFCDKLLAVHCVHLDEEEMKIFKKHGVKVSHNTISNLYLASGICPIPKMLKEGITVGLGVDGAASNNNQDMMELIKTTAILHKGSTMNPLSITADKVLEMATIDGARCIGLESEIGSIKPGKRADIILFDLKEINMRPLNRIISQIVYCGKAENVKTVIIDGKIVMQDRKILTVNEEEIKERTQKAIDRILEKAGLENLREEVLRK